MDNKTYIYQENICDEEPKNILFYDKNKYDTNSPIGADEENELNNSMKKMYLNIIISVVYTTFHL